MNMPQSTDYDNSTSYMFYLETKIATETLKRKAAGHKQVLGVVLPEGLALVLKSMRNSYPKAAIQTSTPGHTQALVTRGDLRAWGWKTAPVSGNTGAWQS